MKETGSFRDEAKAFMQRYKVEFLLAAVLITAFFHAVYTLTAADIRGFMSKPGTVAGFRWLLIALSAVIFLIAQISYPKIYKFKMLLTGYALVAFFINYVLINTQLPFKLNLFGANIDFYTAAIQDSGRFAYKMLFTLLALNAVVIVLASPTVSYGTGRNSAAAAFYVNLALFMAILFAISNRYVMNDTARFATKFVNAFSKYHVAVNLLLFAAAASLSLLHIEEEHNYNSIIVGIAFVSLYCSLTLEADQFYPSKIMLPVMGGVVIFGMLVHWLNCLHHKAHYDPLLKIYNRQYMGNILTGVADVKLGDKFAVLMCDIDHFKKVNDTHGHAAGDAVLYEVAQCIRDTALPEGVVCRYGGEEIIVFLRGADSEGAHEKAEKIRKAVKKKTVKVKNKLLKVTLSVGGAACVDKNSMEKTIKRADDAVYKAKKGGRDKVVIL